MPKHSDRRATQHWAKFGPPLRGCFVETRGQRRIACAGYQPAPRAASPHASPRSNVGGSILCLLALTVSLATSPAFARERKSPEGFANPSKAIAAEIAFAQMAQDKGQWTAFRTTATKDAVMFVPQMVLAQDHLKGRADPAMAHKWQPHQVWSSCDGSIAVTRGAWQSDKATGWFTTIWQRQKKGDYKWLMDQGDETPMALDAPDMIVAKVAECPANYRGGKQKRKDVKGKIALGDPAIRTGKSDDGTLTWEVRVAPDGARNFTMSLKLDGQLTPVQVIEVAAPPAK